jgi:hypothetical protein
VLAVSPWSACFLMWYAGRVFGDIFRDSKNLEKIGLKIICWTPYRKQYSITDAWLKGNIAKYQR